MQKGQDRTNIIAQEKLYRQKRTGRTGQAEWHRQNRKSRKRQAEQRHSDVVQVSLYQNKNIF